MTFKLAGYFTVHYDLMDYINVCMIFAPIIWIMFFFETVI